MLTAYVRHLIFAYLDNVVRRVDRRQPQAAELTDWVCDNAGLIELHEDELDVPPNLRPNSTPPGKLWKHLCRVIAAKRQATKATAPDRVARRLVGLGKMIGLSVQDVAILDAVLRYETCPVVEDLVDEVFTGGRLRMGRAMNLRNAALPTVLGLTANTVCRRFASDAPLVRSGLVQVEDDQDVSCVGRLQRLVSEVDDGADVRELLLGDTRESDLEWSDFDHLGQSRDDVESLLRGALERRARGVNILVHGPPGTGKTEFCGVLASRIGVNLISVGEADERGDEPSRRERLGELRLAQSLLGEDRGAVLLFDEMEDLLTDGAFEMPFGSFRERRHQGGASKVFLNRLLEETPSPTLWTTNIARSINPAILRRMMFALEMRQPPPRIRSRIWSRQLSRHGIDATEEDAAALAHEFDATPGVAAGATAAADIGDGDFETVRRGIRSLSRVLGCERPNAKPVVRFDPSLIEADLDVEDLVARLAAGGQRRFSLCLQGPPGSGKSAYVRHLADRLDLEVLHKRTSDLLSMWVGGSEKNIASAFAEARDDNAFLIFDEADSLLADRRGAEHSWEVSQVNEMLTWMESHPLPFACTTNFGNSLDSAALRRFVFKVTLGYLKPEAAASAFRAFFGLEPPIGLGALAVLTPGDFEVVRRKAGVLGQLDDPDALTAMLRAECAAKPGGSVTIGFGC
ncbi:MAG: AAA family ATPase [Gammaproteobacteria bacterium]|nr:AAA family ATPase [Gammaproteobacteria bacterium]